MFLTKNNQHASRTMHRVLYDVLQEKGTVDIESDDL